MELKTKLTSTPSTTQQTFHQYNIDQFNNEGTYVDGLKKRDKVKIELQRKLARFGAKEWL